MASTEDQSDPTAAVVGAPEPQASDASDAPAGAATRAARPRRSRAKAAAPQAQAEPSDVTSAAGQPSDVAAGADAGAPADGAAADAGPAPAKKVARRSRKAAAAPVAAPAAADAAATDGDAPDAAAQAALPVQTAPASDPIVAAPRKRASRRVAAPTATPESADGTGSADGAAPTDGAPAGEIAASADEVAGGAAPAAATTRTPRKRAPRKTAASAATATAAPAPIAETGDPALDEEAAEAAAEAEAAEEATRAATVPSFGLLFQAPVVVTPRRRATRPSGTPALPVAAADAEAQDTLVLADELEADDIEVGAADADVLTDTDADDAVDDATSPAARRRRRRGGKGRRGRLTDGPSTAGEGAAAAPAPAAGDAPDTATASGPADGSGDEGDGDTDVRSDLASRRRTRRRRRGSSAGEVEDAPGVVTRVREVRSARDEVVGVRGSTRLEAKKQRRREGREAGRRRQVITEAEFLARRESVERVMVVRAKEGRTQIGVLEDNVLVEHYVSRETNASMAGNIYLGKVQNVLPSMEAAFVDIGRGRNAVLYAGEVNWDAAGMEAGASKRIENALESGQSVLVQVTKDPIGHKGARLTSQISLPGRYLVYVPDSSMTGISRKLPDTERARLKRILRDVVPESAGVIVRTAAEGASEEELRADVERLTAIWEQIKAKAEAAGSGKKGKGNSPVLLHGEPDLTVRVIRDVFNEDFAQMIVAGDEAWAQINDYVGSVAPDLASRLTKWTGERDIFSNYRIDEQLAKAMDRKVWLPSGGSLVIDRTEAMTVVDVNTGKFVGSGGNLEETVTKNNLEAAEEIVRQLRLRDIGGIIVVDFIDMVLESNRDLVLRRLVECLSRDRTKHQVAEVTSLGLVQMTRKKLGLGLLETFSEPCEVCAGRGVIVHHDPVVKHRGVQQQSTGGRRPRQSVPSGANGNGGTHVITEGAKSALAQIAASTIHAQETPAAEPAPVESAPAVIVAPEPIIEHSDRLDRPKKPRKKRADGVGSGEKTEKDLLLDSVLNALPEPKAPGQGRGRRRVTTAALSGTPVSATPERTDS